MIKKLKQRVFYDTPRNTGRQYEFDLARAVVIFFFAFIHITIECSTDEALCGGIPYLFDTIIGGSFSAPMYMFVMGVGMFYAKEKSFIKYFQRGAKILGLSYILNLCRYLIPSFIGYGITGETEKYMTPLIYKVLGNDILTFAGLAMMLIAVLINVKTPRWGMLIIAFGSSILGTFLNGMDVKNKFGNIFLGYLIGTEDKEGMVLSDFPLLNWLIFPLCGYLFAGTLVKVKDKKLFYLLISPICMIFTVTYYIYGITNENGMFGEGQNCYYHMIFRDAFASLTLTVGIVGIYYAISLILPKSAMELAKEISRNITIIYFVHWVFTFVIADLLLYIIRGTQALNSLQIVLLGSCISIVSIAIARYFRKYQGRRKQRHEKK